MSTHEVTDVEAFERELAMNRQAFETMREELRSKYAGRFVAIAHGRLVAVADTFDAASTMVFQLQPRPQHFVVFEGDQEPAFEPFFDPYSEFLADDVLPGT